MNHEEYTAALETFLERLGVDPSTAFSVVAEPDKTIVKHVEYEVLPSGTHSGTFWEDVIEVERGGSDEDVLPSDLDESGSV